jgi:DsbC/DsbD-like thiol-disulfide interchange protein
MQQAMRSTAFQFTRRAPMKFRSWRLLRRTAVGAAAVVLAPLVTAPRLHAQSSPQAHARVALISERAKAPGMRPWVGVLFDLDPGWHIYWQNPGDSGEPPKIQWQLPEGWHAGPIRWPRPIRLGSGSVADYGYENQVLLMAPIEAPAGSNSMATASLAADVKYLVCREICIPGKAHLTLASSSGDAANEQSERWQALFEATRGRLPKPTPTTWRVSAQSDKDHFTLSVHTGAQVQSATFFPFEPGQIENSAAQVLTPAPDGFRLTLKKSEQLLQPVSKLRGVVVLSEDGAFEIAAPVAPAARQTR